MSRPSIRGRVDPYTLLAAVCLLFAVAMAAAPAVNAGPTTFASMVLLIGLAGVCCLGLFVLRSGAETSAEPDAAAELFLQALDEPAAVASPDGRLLASNGPWRDAFGTQGRLPKSG